jgi:hypothetical protein
MARVGDVEFGPRLRHDLLPGICQVEPTKSAKK